jgi:hypothetical protein
LQRRLIKKTIRELRLTVAEFCLSCAIDIAPRDSRMRKELLFWMADYLQKELIRGAMGEESKHA